MAPVRASRILAALAAVVALLLAGCGGGQGGSGGETIRIALDWTPNTNHTGLYVAQQQGWFREAGLDVQFLPYNNTSPDTLVSSGAAEVGISFQDSFTFSKAAGADITSVMAVLQHWATQIAVRADRADITSPRDLDGTTYGGFGAAYEEPKMRAVIQDAGGTGTFETVVLGTAAYEALYAGEVDFTEPFIAWEGIEAELRGQPLKTFAYTDYGFPDAYNVLLVANTPWLAAEPEVATRFVQAAQRGYQLAADDPAQAAQLLMDANPGAFSEPELVRRSQEMLAAEYLRDERGLVGTQTLEKWSGYSGWVFDSGALTGPDGAPLADRPDFATWFTNDHLAPTP
ncbi:ABC transporter substrate-binding protein [Pseudonocardia kunmingensis]|uniref:Thiamine pyrimidine synthase n=1 Tax=Pseudonocardia kunmingensis TaxID=630975 RepID=A0A543DWQ1_9PSEU|nr:ABC transporter substrate-binding protein [Pseudonocardia kunmingensis]TQM13767.1 ABC-type nitrate/sulfonate/bicarbonate transport system substrate-binding protein [Pseudonocardia kunmingensis]